MTFHVQNMIGGQALVSGTDKLGNEGKTVVSTTQWDELNARSNFSKATEDFNAVVEEFFAPLTEAAKKAERELNRRSRTRRSTSSSPRAPRVRAKPAEIIQLSRDSIILRLIEEGTPTTSCGSTSPRSGSSPPTDGSSTPVPRG